MATDLGLDDDVNGVNKRFASGFRARVERLLEKAIKSDRNPFNDAATASAAQSSAIQTGQMIAYAGPSAPTGYLECNGAEVSKTQYPALALILGDRYGTASTGKVRLPNAAEAAIAGAGGTRVAGVGTAAGSRFENNTTSLTIAHLPEHRHVIDSISEEDPGHVHDVTAYPNFAISVPDNFKRGPVSGGGSGAVEGEAGASFGEQWHAKEDGASGHYGSGSDWRVARDGFTSIYNRDERGDGQSSTPSGPNETPVEQRNFRTVLFGPNAGGKQQVQLGRTGQIISDVQQQLFGRQAILYREFQSIFSAAAGYKPTPGTIGRKLWDEKGGRRAAASDGSGQIPGQIGGGGSPAPPPFNPTITNPTRQPTNTPAPDYVYVGTGTQKTELNNRTSQNPHGPTFVAPPQQRPNVPNTGAPTPGTNPDDTNRPGSIPTTPGSSGPGSRPRNQTPSTGNNPAEDKSTAPPVATRENPFDTTFYSESQRNELNESIETYYEDYAEQLGRLGGASWSAFIDSASGQSGISYGIVDATALTGMAGAHTHTTSGTMLETGGGGLMGIQQPSFALMWLIKT